MEPWAVILISMGTFLSVFILIFALKQRGNRRRQQLQRPIHSMPIAVQIQATQQSTPYPTAPMAPYPYSSQQMSSYPSQQMSHPGYQPQTMQQQNTNNPGSYPVQSLPPAYIPSTTNQGIFNVDRPAAYNSPFIRTAPMTSVL